jgi:alcohol dehydrogenase class IV
METLNSAEIFQIEMPTKVAFGSGVRHQVIAALQREGWQCLGLVKDQGLQGEAVVDEFINDLQSACKELTVTICDIQEPTYEFLDAKRIELENPKPDVIIGLGGGSAMDTAKAMAVLVHNRQPAISYRGFDQMTDPVLPIIAIPTTAGTGSEVTPNASFIDAPEQRKMGINGEAVRPKYAFLDPDLTLSCPKKPTLSAALDGLVHATEALVAKKTNPWAEQLAIAGFIQIFNSLPKVLDNLGDISARREVMLGAFYAGIALMHSGTGPSAAMSYPLGVRHGVPHGLGGAIFLPHVMKYNAESGFSGYAPLFDGVMPVVANLSGQQKGVELAEKLLKRWREWGVPVDLGLLGVVGDAVPLFIKDTMDLGGALVQNPVEFGPEQIKLILNKLAVNTGDDNG